MTVLGFLFVGVALLLAGGVVAIVAVVVTQLPSLRRFRVPSLSAVVAGTAGCYTGFCSGFAAVILLAVGCMGAVAIHLVSECQTLPGFVPPALLLGGIVVGGLLGIVIGWRGGPVVVSWAQRMFRR
jgi:hypothetical protein